MATPSNIHLTVNDTGVVKHKPQNEATARRTSELLQENHKTHHIFFNNAGFHNHIAHHLLTLYALGAPIEVIEAGYKANNHYQRPLGTVEERILEDMSHPEKFKKYLGKEKYYPDFLFFFQREMEKKGWENVLNEYVFSGTEEADDMLGRLYAGFFHPIIHLGFGIEFNQPAIMAEGLAQAAVHDVWTKNFILKAEKFHKSQTSVPQKTLPELFEDIRADEKLSKSAHWDDANKIRDGVLKRAPDEMINYLTQWTVSEDDLEEKTAEMTNAAVWFAAAAQRPPKQVKFDFFLMHDVNSSVFWPAFNNATWLSQANKVRLLQWKVYLDLAMYTSRRAPQLHLKEITDYTPAAKSENEASLDGVFQRLYKYTLDGHDDGHAVKLGRAVRNGQLVSKKWEDQNKEWLKVKGDMWEKVANMVIDSVEDSGEAWARNVGFEEAWENYGERKIRNGDIPASL